MAILINGVFRSQRITGQQRYATELTVRLLRNQTYAELRPKAHTSRLIEWVWTQSLSLRKRQSLLLSLTSKTPYFRRNQVVVIHDLFVLTNPQWFTRTYSFVHSRLLRRHLKHAIGLVAVSGPVANQLQMLARPQMPIIVVSNAPAKVFSAPRNYDYDQGVLSHYGVKPNAYFLTVGSIDPRKNLKTVITAHEGLPQQTQLDFPLLLVGASSRNFAQAETRSRASARWLDYVPDDHLAVLYAYSTRVLFPSYAEGFGLPLVEAQAAGALTICSDIETFRWVNPSNATYVDPADVDAWTRELERASAMPVSGERELPTESAFDWDVSVSRLIGFVDTLAAGK